MKEERDLVLAPNEFAYVLDRTKGNVDVYVGPNKASLSQTDQLVVFNSKTKRFIPAQSLSEAIQTFAIAPEGWYITLKNPANDDRHPSPKTNNTLVDLNVGHKVNIPGPTSFALWPGQMFRVLKGHNLRSNQYIVARVYDEAAAKRDWEKAVIVAKEGEDGSKAEFAHTMGELIIIKGTDVSFYIPPSGIEVVKENDNYVREAVTLERLEYCVLLDEDGNKRFIKGPDVVFPNPTESFKKDDKGRRKFRAIELNELSGLYIKVVAEYDENKVGDELFITGKDQMIYFPREEHAIIKYGNQDIHFAVAIPAGEARYMMNRMTGEIKTVHGPHMYLADPRKEVIIKRMLDPRLAALWFPKSPDAVAYNKALLDTIKEEEPTSSQMYMQADPTRSAKVRDKMAVYTSSLALDRHTVFDNLSTRQMTDEFQRKQQFTEPRTIVLDTKYDGAIPIDVWTGYAVLVVGRTGKREVVIGPKRKILEYDEFLEKMSLSSGKPKTTDNIVEDVYLRVLHNKVSDVIMAETKDLVEVSVKLSYRVNFEGDETKWFNVENYVKFLTDHLRSVIKGVVKTYGIEEFYENSIAIIRDAVLGKQDENGKRAGRLFEENGMRIYDVEVLNVTIENVDIGDLMIEDQIDTVKKTLDGKTIKRNLEFTKVKEAAIREELETVSGSNILKFDLRKQEAKKQDELENAIHSTKLNRLSEDKERIVQEESNMDFVSQSRLSRDMDRLNFEIEEKDRKLDVDIKEIDANVKATIDKFSAITPGFIESVQSIVELGLVDKITQSVSIPALLGGTSVVDVVQKMFKGVSQVENALSKLKKGK